MGGVDEPIAIAFAGADGELARLAVVIGQVQPDGLAAAEASTVQDR